MWSYPAAVYALQGVPVSVDAIPRLQRNHYQQHRAGRVNFFGQANQSLRWDDTLSCSFIAETTSC